MGPAQLRCPKAFNKSSRPAAAFVRPVIHTASSTQERVHERVRNVRVKHKCTFSTTTTNEHDESHINRLRAHALFKVNHP